MTPRKFAPKIAVAAAALALLSGCTSPRNLLVETAPTAAEVTVISQNGVARSGASPIQVPVDFQYDDFYEIRATPPGGGEQSVRRISRGDFQDLPPVRRRPGTRRFLLRFGPEPAPAKTAAESSDPVIEEEEEEVAEETPAPAPAPSRPSAPLVAGDLLIDSEPAGAFLEVYDATGAVVATGDAPLAMGVDFKISRHYDIRATATGGVEIARVNVDAAIYASLPIAESGARSVVVAAPLFTLVEEVRQKTAPEGKPVNLELLRRAFPQTAERAGAPPALVHVFPHGSAILGMNISPKGKRIVFAQTMPNEKYTDADAGAPHPPSHVRALRLDVRGSVQHITTQNFQDGYPSYSPDGKYIYFSSNRRRNNLADIFSISSSRKSGISDVLVNYRNARVLRPTVAGNNCIAVEFALLNPDTGRIVDSHYIWTIGGPNQHPTQIAKGYQPSISPDGKRVAYIGADHNLWMASVTGADRTQLTSDAPSISRRYLRHLNDEERAVYQAAAKSVTTPPIPPYSHPSWSSDNRFILYASMAGNDPTGRPNEDIWMFDTKNGRRYQLTTNGSVDKYPLMAPDRKSVYFVSNRGKRWSLWRIRVAVPK
ncbi:MAG: hypothetical protein MPK09_01040 [Gammaproteobacteria bacterium]|nr:hypothetical protein [Gammaproteobacteria bacterium]